MASATAPAAAAPEEGSAEREGSGSRGRSSSTEHSAKLQRWKAKLYAAAAVQNGSQGSVVTFEDEGVHMAAKMIAGNHPAAIRSEVKALKRLNNAHPHVVHHYGMLRGRSGSCYVFQELATADMHDVAGMHSRRCMGEGAYVREWMLQLAHGVSFCHSNLVAHRDIKPENVLLVPFAVEPGRPPPSKTYFKRLVTQVWQDPSPAVATAASARIRDGFVAKVCDFGSSLVSKSAGQVAKSACGSQFYCAPEVRRLIAFRLNPEEAEDVWPSSTYKWEAIHSAGYDAFAADVWSFGMMLFTLTTGLKPFRSPCVADPRFQAFLRDTQRHVMQDELCAPHSAVWTRNLEDYRPAWRWPKAMSPALADLLKRCLKFRPADRCTMAQVLEHPWFADPTWRPASISRSIGSAQWAAARGPSDVSSDVPSRVLSGAGSDRAGALTFLSRATSDAKSDLTPLNMASTLSAGGGEGGVCSPLPAPAASSTSPAPPPGDIFSPAAALQRPHAGFASVPDPGTTLRLPRVGQHKAGGVVSRGAHGDSDATQQPKPNLAVPPSTITVTLSDASGSALGVPASVDGHLAEPCKGGAAPWSEGEGGES